MNRSAAIFLLSSLFAANVSASNIIRTNAPVAFSNSAQDNWVGAEPLISDWIDQGGVVNCTNWIPSPSTVQEGVLFEQTGYGCEKTQTRQVQSRETNTRDGSFRSVGEPKIESRILSDLTTSRTSTGELSVPSAKYFRVYIEQNQINSGYSRLVEIEMLDSLNVDLFDQYTVLASESSHYGLQYTAERAIDNNLTDRWTSSSSGANSWVAYQFPQVVNPVKFTIRNYPSTAGNSQQPKVFRIEKSNDGVNWVVIKRFDNEIDWSGGEYRVYDLL